MAKAEASKTSLLRLASPGEQPATTHANGRGLPFRPADDKRKNRRGTILERRKDERDEILWSAWFEANTEANGAAELLGLFFRRPDLAQEFAFLAEKTECEYGDAVSKRALIEAQLGGEVEVEE